MPKSADDSFKPPMISKQDMEQFKRRSCIYPVYFDFSRTLQEGRRVPLHVAVRNPLAKDLAEAAASLGIYNSSSRYSPRLFTSAEFCSQGKYIQRIGQIPVVYGMRSSTNQVGKQPSSTAKWNFLRLLPNTFRRILPLRGVQ